jgi:hypothetical protein
MPNMTITLPQFIRDLLASPPRRGEGLNLWFYRVARVLHPYRDAGEIVELLRAATAGEPVMETLPFTLIRLNGFRLILFN